MPKQIKEQEMDPRIVVTYEKLQEVVHARAASGLPISGLLLSAGIDPDGVKALSQDVGEQVSNDPEHEGESLKTHVAVAFSMGMELGATVATAIQMGRARKGKTVGPMPYPEGEG